MKLFFIFICFLFTNCAVFAQSIDNALLLDYYQSQRYGDAAKYLKGVYAEPVTNLKALSNLAYASQMAGNLPDAEGYYQRLFNRDSTKVSVLFNLGGINLARGNNQRALVFYKKILTIDSTNFRVYKQLATLAQNLADTVSLTKYLQKANAINPQEPDVAYDLSTLYIGFNQYDKAGVALNKAIAADTANLSLLKSFAHLNYMQKKFPETINTCLKLVRSGEKSSAIINWLFLSYFKTRQYKLCLSTLQMLAPDMQNESTFYYAAMCYKALDDQPNSVVFMQKALDNSISPNVANYYTEIADAYDRLHQFKKAVAANQKSLQFTETPLVYYSLANIYDTELKDKKNAIKYYKKYLNSKPGTEEQKYIDYAKLRVPELGK